jgi:LmbE family N-acetylglucosaminyl deacetylase
MDDETLACGGTMLLHADKRRVHCLFATDGARSPVPPLPWLGTADPRLAGTRRREALAAATRIGIPHANLRFLDLPDGRLASRQRELVTLLRGAIDDIRPAFVLAPFRHDVHPDHIALNRAARVVLRGIESAPALLEYFVYHRLRGLPGGDVRRAVDEGGLVCIDTATVAAAKREALDCYRSQTTIGYAWQSRPILTPESLQVRCAEAECFLPSDPRAAVSAGLRSPARVRLACLAMRYGKPPKERFKALLRWAMRR